MGSYCTRCGAALPRPSATCAHCASDGLDNASTTGSSALHWGIGPPALGLLALVPTALLVASLALLIPLPIATVGSAAALGILQLALVWLLAFRSWPVPLPMLGLSRPASSWARTLAAIGAAIVCSLGFAHLYTTAVTALGWDFLAPPELPDDLILPGGLAIISALALAVWTPLAEEVFFRGFVMRGMVNRWGFVPGLVLSAAAFSALHFQPAILLPVFFIGLLLGGLYWYTKSLWPCVAVHAAQNLVAVATVVFTQ